MKALLLIVMWVILVAVLGCLMSSACAHRLRRRRWHRRAHNAIYRNVTWKGRAV